MTPKRFKAVCTETGREFGTDDLVCGGYVRDDLYKPIGLYWSVEFQDKNQAAIDSILCQSTGLTDANGQEVFEGDVLMRKNGAAKWEVYWNEKEAAFWRKANEYDYCPLGQMKDLFVIGNRWMPQAKLQARAEAVSNG